MALEVGTLLNERYKITAILGQGGMGAVYKAEDVSLGVEVAVKENLVGNDDDFTRQFKREATILASMRHPNLTRVTDHFAIEGQGQYLVMDFVEGEDLRERLQRVGKLPEKEVVLIGVAICDALSYLHNQDPPILHRDIKPGNIKITPSGHVYLVDFGLAKIGETSQQTTTGARGLTPGYSPPEQYGSARTDQRSDIYALSATLYAMLTGTPPEDGLSIAIEQNTLTKITDRNPNTSKQLASVIERGLDVKPEKRFQSAEDLKRSLLEASDTIQREVAMGEVTIAPPPPEAFKKKIKDELAAENKSKTAAGVDIGTSPTVTMVNTKTLYGAIGGGVLLILLAIIFVPRLFGGGGDNAGSEPTEISAAVETTEEPVVSAEPTATELPPTPSSTPTGGGPQIAYASDQSGSFQIWMIDLATDEETQLTDITGGACQPAWSPDGTQLVFISPCAGNSNEYTDSNLYLLNMDGSDPIALPSRAGDQDPVWSPDGTQLAFTSERVNGRPQIFVMDMETLEVYNFSDSTTRDQMPSWSPDGEFMVYMIHSNQVWYHEIATGKIGKISSTADDERPNSKPQWSPLGDRIIFQQDSNSGGPPYFQVIFWDGIPQPGIPIQEDHYAASIAIPMRDPRFSPDGRWVVFDSNRTGSHDIYILTTNGTDLQQITEGEGIEFDPAWRPGT